MYFTASDIRRGEISSFGPRGDFEAVARAAAGGIVRVYARYIGTAEQAA